MASAACAMRLVGVAVEKHDAAFSAETPIRLNARRRASELRAKQRNCPRQVCEAGDNKPAANIAHENLPESMRHSLQLVILQMGHIVLEFIMMLTPIQPASKRFFELCCYVLDTPIC
jgi:hypothetical protein